MAEVWLPVVGWEQGYEVSSQGSVRSVDRLVPNGTGGMRLQRGCVLKTCLDKDGYQTLTLWRAGNGRTSWVHVLVLEAFGGPRPAQEARIEACHNDGNRLNNNADNLRWGTRKENAADAIAHGTQPKGQAHGRNLLTEAQVLAIFHSNDSPSALARQFRVSRGAVKHIQSGRNWAWLTCPDGVLPVRHPRPPGRPRQQAAPR